MNEYAYLKLSDKGEAILSQTFTPEFFTGVSRTPFRIGNAKDVPILFQKFLQLDPANVKEAMDVIRVLDPEEKTAICAYMMLTNDYKFGDSEYIVNFVNAVRNSVEQINGKDALNQMDKVLGYIEETNLAFSDRHAADYNFQDYLNRKDYQLAKTMER